MFSFTAHQEIYQLGTVFFGGQPGIHPTVCFGGLFFKDSIDIAHAKKQIDTMLQVSEDFCVPGIPDFFIRREKDVDLILSLIEDSLPSDHPFSVDVTDPLVKIAVLQKLNDRELLSRTIYNSIHVGITDKEREALSNHTPAMAIIVAFNPKDASVDGKVEVLQNGANLIDKGLLDLASDCGIDRVLVDTAALAPGHLSGAAIAALPVVKEEFGLPSGCAIHNVVEKSTWLNTYDDVKPLVDQASNINVSLFGGDFLLFGPIEHASRVFPLIAWENILISEYVEGYFGVSPSSLHPRRRFFKW